MVLKQAKGSPRSQEGVTPSPPKSNKVQYVIHLHFIVSSCRCFSFYVLFVLLWLCAFKLPPRVKYFLELK